MTNYLNPRRYDDPAAKAASGVTHPPLPQPVSFVTTSPGDLFLAQRGLSAQTKALITRLQSFNEVRTSRNEIIQVNGLTAIDVGAGNQEGSRDLLVLPEEGGEEGEDVAVEEEGVTNDIEDVTGEKQTTVESSNPSDPDQYEAPSGSRVINTASGGQTTLTSFQLRGGGSFRAYYGG